MIATRELAAERREVGAAVERARSAQPCWALSPVRARARFAGRVEALVAARARDLVGAVSSARPTPPFETLTAEVLPLAAAARLLAHEAATILAPRRLGARGRPAWLAGVATEVRREPLGVVLVVGPANYALFLPAVQTLQALVAGCSVLWKPAPHTRTVALAFARLVAEAGLPAGLLEVLPEDASAARAAIEEGVDKVILTGSSETGEAVLEQLAPGVTPATVELSGCDACFVLEGADLALATRAIAFSLRLNGGETCIAPRRAFVRNALVGSLGQRLAKALAREEGRPIARVAAEKARRLVLDAVARGARVVAGRLPGEDVLSGAPFAPVILDLARSDMPLLQEDVLAPVLAIVSVEGDDAALAASRGCPFALGATIFGPEERALALAGRVRAGVVVVNDAIVPTADPRVPFGGRGRSGFGVTRGPEGLLELTATKVVAVSRGPSRRHLEPGAPGDEALVLGWLSLAHGGSLAARGAGALSVLGELARRARRAVLGGAK